MPQSPDQAIEELIESPPRLHGAADSAADWSIGDPVLRWLAEYVQDGWRTLETGCGHSTIVFALKGAEHTVIAPDPTEHERVREWCEERGFSTERVTSVADFSQRALPLLGDDPLDLGVIDGAHSFPAPFIDWYYIAVRLRPGGLLVVDDTHLRTGELLQDFLLSEEGRWQLERNFGTTALFRKLTDDPPIPATDWSGQPWVRDALEPESRLRRTLRPRSRIRELLSRVRG